MHNAKIKRLLTKFASARRFSSKKQPEKVEKDDLITDKLGRYYLIYDILYRCDEALSGKMESSPTREYKQHVKNTLDSFESSVKSEALRRNLKYDTTFDNSEYDTINEISEFSYQGK